MIQKDEQLRRDFATAREESDSLKHGELCVCVCACMHACVRKVGGRANFLVPSMSCTVTNTTVFQKFPNHCLQLLFEITTFSVRISRACACWWRTEIGDERRRLKCLSAEFSEHEKMYEEQRRRHIALQQRVKKEERKAAAEAHQLELYVIIIIIIIIVIIQCICSAPVTC